MQHEPMPWEALETPPPGNSKGPIFQVLDEDHYRLTVADLGVTLDVDRIRRERHQLVGELLVRCDLPGALTRDGVLSVADVNLSSVRARQERARYLGARAQTNNREVDWTGLLEELAQQVLEAERRGQPAVDLRTLPRPAPDDALEVDGLTLPRRHASIIFGDGGAAKSYMALFFLGRLAERGLRTALFDWELAGEDHRDRLERLFGEDMPAIVYARCERPLVNEVDRLRRICRDEEIDFAGFDSVAFACDGPPEAAEVAGRYFRAVRQIGVGSLHVAHISKSDGADAKPFGSAFWHNGARATWFAKLAEATPGGRSIQLGLFNRKANLGALRSAVGFEITFEDTKTTFRRADLARVPDLAAKLSIRQRMVMALRGGALSRAKLAEQIDANEETVKRTANRDKRNFVILDGGFIGLRESNL